MTSCCSSVSCIFLHTRSGNDGRAERGPQVWYPAHAAVVQLVKFFTTDRRDSDVSGDCVRDHPDFVSSPLCAQRGRIVSPSCFCDHVPFHRLYLGTQSGGGGTVGHVREGMRNYLQSLQSLRCQHFSPLAYSAASTDRGSCKYLCLWGISDSRCCTNAVPRPRAITTKRVSRGSTSGPTTCSRRTLTTYVTCFRMWMRRLRHASSPTSRIAIAATSVPVSSVHPYYRSLDGFLRNSGNTRRSLPESTFLNGTPSYED